MEEELELPKYFALKATYGNAPFKYLGVEDDGKLAYSTDKVMNQRAKFAIEYSVSPGLAHIRSCYNNNYWVRLSESENWIVATAKDPLEDKSTWNCTLFKTNLSEDGKMVKFDHVQLGKTVGRRDVAPDREMYLCLDPLAITLATSTVFDYRTLVTLPRYVSFKDPKKGSYLSTRMNSGYNWPIFSIYDGSDLDFNVYEVFTSRDGYIYLRSIYKDSNLHDKYWGIISYPANVARYYAENLISYKEFKGNGEPTDTDMLFSVVDVTEKDDKNTMVALRHLRTNKFLKKQDGGYYISGIGLALTATSDSTTEDTKLEVVEPVRRREINVTQFHLDRARVYDRIPLTLAEGGASNSSETSEQEFTLELTYAKKKTFSWSKTNSWNVNFNISLSSGIPFIGDVGISIGGGYSSDYQWGKSDEKSEEVKSSYTVKVPPLTKVTVKVVATEGKCDVPYSYHQTDHKMNGEVKTTKFTDGIYNCVNSYHFDYDVQFKPLNATS